MFRSICTVTCSCVVVLSSLYAAAQQAQVASNGHDLGKLLRDMKRSSSPQDYMSQLEKFPIGDVVKGLIAEWGPVDKQSDSQKMDYFELLNQAGGAKTDRGRSSILEGLNHPRNAYFAARGLRDVRANDAKDFIYALLKAFEAGREHLESTVFISAIGHIAEANPELKTTTASELVRIAALDATAASVRDAALTAVIYMLPLEDSLQLIQLAFDSPAFLCQVLLTARLASISDSGLRSLENLVLEGLSSTDEEVKRAALLMANRWISAAAFKQGKFSQDFTVSLVEVLEGLRKNPKSGEELRYLEGLLQNVGAE